MDIHEEADEILEVEHLIRTQSYNHDLRYQRLSKKYLEAIRTENWKEAHDILILINLIKERFSRGERVLNGEWK